MRRTIELTGLAHRKHYRSLEGLEHWLRARFDTISVSKTRYTNVSLPRFRRLIEGAQRLLSPLPFKGGEPLARQQRALEKVQKVIDLYEPFILDNEYFFAADHIKSWPSRFQTKKKSASTTTQKALTGTTIGSTCTFRRCAGGLIP